MLQEEDNGIDLGIYGLGNVRTHKDYELYTGINFLHRKLHPNTLKGINPPINDHSEWYLLEIESNYDYTLNIPSTENFDFIYVGIEDDKGSVLFRQDLTEYKPQLRVSFKSTSKPHKWVYWPRNKQGEWVNRKDTLL
jgi:hypothetical protein